MNDSSILNSREQIAELDKSNVLGSIESLADQLKHAWNDTQEIKFTPSTTVRNVVVAGMGGSGLGPDVVKHLFKEQLSVPFEVINSYHLPQYVDQHSLVILSSYSGTTEEILSCASDAQSAQAQIMVITSGGTLQIMAQEHDWPAYFINPEHNPSNQPRMAIGYAIMGCVGLLNAAKIITVEKSQLEDAVTAVIKTDEQCRVEVPHDQNRAKILALEAIDRRPVIVASEFLQGAVHVSTNQFNENAKAFVDYKVVPEINHHLLEGLTYPKSNSTNHIFFFVMSELYGQRNQKRMELTQQVAEQKHIDTLAVKMTTGSKLAQVFEEITLFAYANFYLAMLEKIDPAPIKTVDWFKEQLKQA